MRHYEAMYIVDADTPDELLEPIIEKYKKVVVDGGGEVTEAGAKLDDDPELHRRVADELTAALGG